jgi:6-phosphogluconolactonase
MFRFDVDAADAAPRAALEGGHWVYIGTYSGAKSRGIYRSRFDPGTGRLDAPELAAEAQNPSFLAVHPQGPTLYAAERPLLYAVNELGTGSVSAYAVDRATGSLRLLNRQSSRGAGPCHLSVDRAGRHVLVANYGGGSVAVLPIEADGRLGEAKAFIQHTGSSVNPQRQQGPHAHWISTDPSNRFVLVCDLGLDKVLLYRFDADNGTLQPHDPAYAPLTPGSGPRHLAFHPNGRWAYVINELSNTITAFRWDGGRGALDPIQTAASLPPDFAGRNTTAEIAIHPSGRFLYGSNRGHDSLVVLGVAGETGALILVQHQPAGGRTPRHFAIDPTGRWLVVAHQDSDTVTVMRIDAGTGRLTPTGQRIEVGRPVCLEFVPVR